MVTKVIQKVPNLDPPYWISSRAAQCSCEILRKYVKDVPVNIYAKQNATKYNGTS